MVKTKMKSKTYLKYILLGNFLLIYLFSSNVSNSQDVDRRQPPKGEINMFKTFDNSEAAKEYNALTTRPQRDSLIKKRLDEDWTHTIPVGFPPIMWACGSFTQQLDINSHDYGDGVFLSEGLLLFNGYRGKNLDSIYQNHGTLRDLGKLGLPLWQVTIFDSITRPEGHAMVAVLTGDDFD